MLQVVLDQQNGNHQRQQAGQRAGQLGFVHQIVGSLISRLFGVVTEGVEGFRLVAQVDADESPAEQGHEDRGKRAVQDGAANIDPQQAGGGQRTGRGRDIHMGRQQTGGQAHTQDGQGDAGLFVDGLDQRGQNDKGRIRKDRNGNDVAGDGHGQAGALLPYQLDGVQSHPVGAFGGVQVVAQHDPEDNDDADALHRSGKSAGNGADQIGTWHTSQKTHDQGCGQKGYKGAGFDLQAQEHQNGNADKKHKFDRHSAFLLKSNDKNRAAGPPPDRLA